MRMPCGAMMNSKANKGILSLLHTAYKSYENMKELFERIKIILEIDL